MNISDESLKKHCLWKGKIEVISRIPLESADDLALAYTPGVAAACLEIQSDLSKSFELTRRGNLVAVVTDGSAVLGLGNIGPEAGMPVMEGKCALFKAFGGVDAVPVCIRSNDTEDIIRTVKLIAGSFGGINLEDISAPRCFEIEERLKKECDIPVFHDDQHGTAIVTLAAMLNALKLTGKRLCDIKVTVNGAGAAGIAVTRLLMSRGLKNVIVCDRKGTVYKGRNDLNPLKSAIAEITNPEGIKGTLADAMKGSDAFIGVSSPGCVTEDMVRTMAPDPILFPLANPVPEIMPEAARHAGAAVIGTGRSDYPNQINNVLAFPGIFRGALDAHARDITEDMQLAAADAIADMIPPGKLSPEYIIPSPLDKGVAPAVAKAVAAAWKNL
ncbi:MAG: NADP-dependent malic enzyme [Huintestinicola sp.]